MRAGKGAVTGARDAAVLEEELDAHGIAAGRLARLAPGRGRTCRSGPGRIERVRADGVAVHEPKPRTRRASSRRATIQRRSHPRAQGSPRDPRLGSGSTIPPFVTIRCQARINGRERSLTPRTG